MDRYSVERVETTRTADPSVWPGLVAVAAMAANPFLALVVQNLDQPLDGGAVVVWWLCTTVVAISLVFVTGLRDRSMANWVAGVVAALLWFLFNLPLVVDLRPPAFEAVADLAWWGVCAGVVMLIAVPVMRHPVAQRFIAILGVALVATTAAQGVAGAGSVGSPSSEVSQDAGNVVAMNDTPNVWFIVLDGMASNDFVRSLGSYDPERHEAAMRASGFRIQSEASSNYPLTYLSVGATLEAAYGFTGSSEPAMGPWVRRLQGDNATVDAMRTNGYSYVHARPDLWSGNRCGGREDLCIGHDGEVSETDLALTQMTPLARLYTGRPDPTQIAANNDPAEVVRAILDADVASPRFTFVHVLNPHPPLLRDSSCTVRDVPLELSEWGSGPEYSDAVQCLHRQLESAVAQILAVDDDPVIILQGDHGPRLDIDWDQPGGVLLGEDMHFSIYSAIRLPNACDDIVVPEDLTSVNTFRIVRACLKQSPVELLDNRRFPILAER